MDISRPIKNRTGPRIVLAGAVLSAVLGVEAGAALRPAAEERGKPPPPQLMVVAEPQLVVLEAAGAGWPGREPG
jgi:hypothetical protein